MIRSVEYNHQIKLNIGTSITEGIKESEVERVGILIQNRSESAKLYYYLTEEAIANDAGFIVMPNQVHYFDNISPKNKIWFNSSEENTEVVILTTI